MELQNAGFYHSILKHFSHTFHTVLVRRNIKDWYKVCPLWEVSCLCMSFHNNLEKSWKSSTGTECFDDDYFWKDYLTYKGYLISVHLGVYTICLQWKTVQVLDHSVISESQYKIERNWKWKAIVVATLLLSRTYQTIRCKLFHSFKTAITNYSFPFAVKLDVEKKINFKWH